MADSLLFLNGQPFQVKKHQLISKCELFKRNVNLLDSDYGVQSEVSISSFRDFLSALDDQPITISEENQRDLFALCTEFRFNGLSSAFAAFQIPMADSAHGCCAFHRARIENLEECLFQSQRRNVLLDSRVSRLERNNRQIMAELAAIRASHWRGEVVLRLWFRNSIH
jgi:hypothetical protein